MRKVIFVALTSYQLFISDAYARYISDNTDDVDIIILYSGPSHRHIETNDAYKILYIKDFNNSKIQRFWRRLIWGRLFILNPYKKNIASTGKIYLFTFNDMDPVTSKIINEVSKCKDKTISLIEEGIGIYETSEIKINPLKKGIRIFVTWLLGSTMQYRAIGDNTLINYVIVENTDLYKQLEKSEGQSVVKMDKRSIFTIQSDFIRRMEVIETDIGKYDIMYLGQTFDEFGELNDDEYSFLLFVFDLTERIGKKVLIKPHPLDKSKKYKKIVERYNNVSVLNDFMGTLPIECMIKLICVNSVITFNSSAGLNLANSFETIRVVFTFDMDETKMLYEIWSNGYAELNREAFKNDYGNIFVPKTSVELECLLKGVGGSNDLEQKVLDKNVSLSEIDEILGL